MTDNGDRTKTRMKDWVLYRRMLLQARPYWPHICAIFLLSLLDGPLGLLSPLPLKIAVDSAIGSHPLPPLVDRLLPNVATGSPTAILVLAVALGVVITVIGGLLGIFSSFVWNYTAEKLTLSFRALLFRHMQRL